MNGDGKLELNYWFEIDNKEYFWYILQGYEIIADEEWVTWRLNDRYHRTDGPAIIWADGRLDWRLNGQLHRTDGPAIINASGTQEWWLNGSRFTGLPQ